MTPKLALSESEELILSQMVDAETKAWRALSGYKFWMFGYHAGRWINYNKLLSHPKPNPFGALVRLSRERLQVPAPALATEQEAKHAK